MKKYLTIEQSQHLNKLGIPKKEASEVMFNHDIQDYAFVYNMMDLLRVAPKEIDEGYTTFYLTITTWNSKWDVNYYSKSAESYLSFIQDNDELIDAMYELLCWYLKYKSGKKCST